MIKMVVEVAGECGLNINKGKSNVLLFNHDRIRLEEVGGMKVSNTIRYLGVDVGDSIKCFREYRKGKIQLAERMANLTVSVISKSCDKLLIGKTYWKSVVQPRVLSAAAEVVWTKDERKQFQRVENRVWRQILGAPIYTPVAALQGEIGASSVEGRDMKMKLKFANYMANTANGLLAAIFRKLTSEARPKIWVRQLREYLGELGLYFSDVGRMDTDDIGREINKWENNGWRRDIESKTTLELYRSKGNFGDEGMYSNEYGSVLLFQCRTNTLKLRWRQGFEDGAMDCLLCRGGEETLRHFVMESRELQEIRRRYGVYGTEALEEGLMFMEKNEEKVNRCKKMLEEMWRVRRRKLSSCSEGK